MFNNHYGCIDYLFHVIADRAMNFAEHTLTTESIHIGKLTYHGHYKMRPKILKCWWNSSLCSNDQNSTFEVHVHVNARNKLWDAATLAFKGPGNNWTLGVVGGCSQETESKRQPNESITKESVQLLSLTYEQLFASKMFPRLSSQSGQLSLEYWSQCLWHSWRMRGIFSYDGILYIFLQKIFDRKRSHTCFKKMSMRSKIVWEKQCGKLASPISWVSQINSLLQEKIVIIVDKSPVEL
jgi:hypothetical protein